MKKTIIAGVVVSALTASSAFAIEGGLASQNGFPAALEEIKTALNDPNGAQFARAQDVAMRRLGLNFNDAEVFVSAVRSGKDVSHFGEPAVPPAPTYVAPVAVPHATPTAVPVAVPPALVKAPTLHPQATPALPVAEPAIQKVPVKRPQATPALPQAEPSILTAPTKQAQATPELQLTPAFQKAPTLKPQATPKLELTPAVQKAPTLRPQATPTLPQATPEFQKVPTLHPQAAPKLILTPAVQKTPTLHPQANPAQPQQTPAIHVPAATAPAKTFDHASDKWKTINHSLNQLIATGADRNDPTFKAIVKDLSAQRNQARQEMLGLASPEQLAKVPPVTRAPELHPQPTKATPVLAGKTPSIQKAPVKQAQATPALPQATPEIQKVPELHPQATPAAPTLRLVSTHHREKGAMEPVFTSSVTVPNDTDAQGIQLHASAPVIAATKTAVVYKAADVTSSASTPSLPAVTAPGQSTYDLKQDQRLNDHDAALADKVATSTYNAEMANKADKSALGDKLDITRYEGEQRQQDFEIADANRDSTLALQTGKKALGETTVLHNEVDIHTKALTRLAIDKANQTDLTKEMTRATGVEAGHETRITTLENAPKPQDGKDGTNGKDGINGKDGATGPAGKDGKDGLNGANGKDGATGPAGRDGKDGLNGTNGKDGKDVDPAVAKQVATNTTAIDSNDAHARTLAKGELTIGKLAVQNHQQIATNQHALTRQAQNFTALQTAVSQAQDTGTYAHARIDDANKHIAANRQALADTNKRVADNSKKLANHEARIQDLESNNQTNFNKLQSQQNKVRKEFRAGVAGAVALTQIPQVQADQSGSFGMAVGTFNGENAIAAGVSSRLSGAVTVKSGLSWDTQGNVGAGAGVSVGW
ncbi:TPA: YadA-like family protein [Enterobacter hormaechei]|uniref:YadA-like family protein n=1 Tax=Enterobacter hormaechei TaxID=158836 RepID=UPI00285FA82B|nr:YadA-like family protein [Enterobacter hormaechei]ELD3465903.1 YadA-like family protein [Enterobacter hormaechei]ELD3469148.1 YadA-like family protein [Enterobacter hormaechei]MED5730564.1 YadA-like family protein [Enterobacter hormaechei]HBM2509765.1 YadA-like family protein [Enterobacter hormaechei]HBM2528996.1 YadA-like family protein [Enterobacter hormaechei]